MRRAIVASTLRVFAAEAFMAQNPNESMERSQDRDESRQDTERESGMFRDEEDVRNRAGDESGEDVDPDSADSEVDRDDTLTD
jgi:hypothetical protein